MLKKNISFVLFVRFEDKCGVYWPFEVERNIPVECNSGK